MTASVVGVSEPARAFDPELLDNADVGVLLDQSFEALERETGGVEAGPLGLWRGTPDPQLMEAVADFDAQCAQLGLAPDAVEAVEVA